MLNAIFVTAIFLLQQNKETVSELFNSNKNENL